MEPSQKLTSDVDMAVLGDIVQTIAPIEDPVNRGALLVMFLHAVGFVIQRDEARDDGES